MTPPSAPQITPPSEQPTWEEQVVESSTEQTEEVVIGSPTPADGLAPRLEPPEPAARRMRSDLALLLVGAVIAAVVAWVVLSGGAR